MRSKVGDRVKARIEERWGLPFAQLLQDLADQGLGAKFAAKVLGVDYQRVLLAAAKRLGIVFESSKGRARISMEQGRPFASVMRDLVRQGLSTAAIARKLGITSAHLRRDPPVTLNPDTTIAQDYVRATGQSVGAAAAMYAARGVNKNDAAQLIGFYCGSKLLHYLRSRNISDPWEAV